jgi:uncharacterized membrane protein YsdA (DUF1294 family)
VGFSENIILGLFIGLNIFSFILMGYDKYQAKKNNWRVSERNIFILALVGGALGVFSGMKFFHHKTRHRKFIYGIPFLIIINSVGYIFLIFRF